MTQSLSPDTWKKINRIVNDALDLPEHKRDAYIDQACAEEAVPAEEVRSLIAMDAVPTSEISPFRQSPIDEAEETGKQIGPYRLERLLGKGGMGEAWLAERIDGAFDRKVAVKLIRWGMDHPVIIKRFRRERQILASLDHPNIARLYDGGATQDDLPYLVLEFIDGLPIDAHCRENGLSLPRRLELFRKVCDAVDCAHRHGVIHRDIKPGNILVTRQGEPKLLDFGIARVAMNQEATYSANQLMTPAYASPEQIRGEPVSFATDIYSLGVLLYELLTGRRPHAFENLSLSEVLRIIDEEEPRPPGAFLTGEPNFSEVPTAANDDHTSGPYAILDHIVLKALRKDPEKRHLSAARFKEQLRRYLENLPVLEPEDKPYDATICFTPQHADAAKQLTANLQNKLSLNPTPVCVLEGNRKAIQKDLDRSRCAILLVGREERPWLLKPLYTALADRVALGTVFVIPLLLPGAVRPDKESSLPRFLRRGTWPVMTQDGKTPGLGVLVRGHQPGVALPMPAGVCPFRGLEVFREQDRRFFFGREALVARLWDRLTTFRFLAVLGPSGSGKSSVVQAGLIPTLRKEGIHPVLFTPGKHPLEELAFALMGLETELQLETDFVQKAQENVTTLHTYVEALNAKGERLGLVIDQFEEMFTLCENRTHAHQLIANLLYALEHGSKTLAIIITMRSDFIGRCVVFPDLNCYLCDHFVQVEPMDDAAVARVIEVPAQLAGLTFEAGLVNRIQADLAASEAELPVLEHALLELYNRRRGHRLTADAYEEIGGVSGALAQRAETEYARLSEQEKWLMRKMFTLCLVHPGEGAEDTRRRATREELLAIGSDEAATAPLIDTLIEARLLTSSFDAERQVISIDVAHEALIRRWHRITEWMEEDRETARKCNDLRRQAAQWDEAGRDRDHLPRGSQLVQLEALFESEQGHLGVLVEAYMHSALTQRDAMEQAEEEARQKEVRLARSMATRSRVIAALTLFALIILAFFTWSLNLKERETERQRKLAMTRELETNQMWVGVLRRDARESLKQNKPALALHLATRYAQHARQTSDWDKRFHFELYSRAWPKSILMPHGRALAKATFNADQTRVMTYSPNHAVLIWDADKGIYPTTKIDPAGGASFAAFNQKGDRVIVCTAKNEVGIWDTKTGELLQALPTHSGLPYGAVFSPDETKVLTWSIDRSLHLWDLANPEAPLHRLVLPGPPGDVRFLLEDHTISASFNSNIMIWRPDQKFRRLLLHTGSSVTYERSPDGKVLVVGTDSGKVIFYEMDTWAAIPHEGFHEGWVTSLDFNASGKVLMTSGQDTKLNLWDVAKRKPTTFWPDSMTIHGSWHPDGRHVLTFGLGGAMRIWDTAEGETVGPSLLTDSAPTKTAFLTSKNQAYSVGFNNHSLELWDLVSGTKLGPRMMHDDQLLGITVADNEEQMLTWSRDGVARIWQTKDPPFRKEIKHPGKVLDALFNADESRVLSWCDKGRSQLWGTIDGRVVWTHDFLEDKIDAVINSTGSKALIWSSAGVLKLIDLTKGHPIFTVQAHAGGMRGAAFYQNDRILTWSDDEDLALFSETTGAPIRTMTTLLEGIHWLKIHPTQSLGLVKTGAERLSLIALPSGRIIGEKMKHASRIIDARFDVDMGRVTSWGDDRKVRFWDLEGKPKGAPLDHKGPVYHVVRSPDKRIAAVTGATGRVTLWQESQQAGPTHTFIHEGGIWAMVFTDKDQLLTGGADGKARLWHTITGRQVNRTYEHGESIDGAQFVEDEKYLVLWGGQTISYHRVKDGVQLGAPLKHHQALTKVTLTKDKKQVLAVAGHDVRLWYVGIDEDVPRDLLPLRAMLQTGMTLDTSTDTTKVLSPEEYREVVHRYIARAGAHYQECRYKDANAFKRLFPEEAAALDAGPQQ